MNECVEREIVQRTALAILGGEEEFASRIVFHEGRRTTPCLWMRRYASDLDFVLLGVAGEPRRSSTKSKGVGSGGIGELMGVACLLLAHTRRRRRASFRIVLKIARRCTRRERRNHMLASEPAQTTELSIPDAKAIYSCFSGGAIEG